MGVFDKLSKKKKEKQLFEEPKKFGITQETPLSSPTPEAKKSIQINPKVLEEKLAFLIEKRQKQKTLSKIIPKKEKSSEKKQETVQQKEALKKPKIVIESETKEEAEDKKALRVMEFFLMQLGEELGSGNEFEIIKLFRVGDGWRALAKVNGDLYSFVLAVNGEIVSFEELESGLEE